MLSKIPLIPTLIADGDKSEESVRGEAEGGAKEETVEADNQCEGASVSKSMKESLKEEEGMEQTISLFQWISAKDNQSSLELLAEQCSRGLEQVKYILISKFKCYRLSNNAMVLCMVVHFWGLNWIGLFLRITWIEALYSLKTELFTVQHLSNLCPLCLNCLSNL